MKLTGKLIDDASKYANKQVGEWGTGDKAFSIIVGTAFGAVLIIIVFSGFADLGSASSLMTPISWMAFIVGGCAWLYTRSKRAEWLKIRDAYVRDNQPPPIPTEKPTYDYEQRINLKRPWDS
ncbi:hypothetical protein I5770_01115 [Brucella sp. BO2]|uniref:hypothetical protein n=1 Tax=Brucella sp. BO2 TaxID=693750 RepID=UPI00046D51C7|nr:hypothetical protein [Brucella sp. BO2]QPN27286.1 hypothetical protein I5770_01115 [Brucella sp. BO2]